ncbi:MAG: Rrf2 family transcriptional regulator [Pseudorhodoplanes sp.]
MDYLFAHHASARFIMLVSRKAVLAVAAVVDVALNGNDRPVSAKSLASRHQLPPRHLEPVLQALVHRGILKGIRGPHGGYELGRMQKSITADEIVQAAGTVEQDLDGALPGSTLLCGVVAPAMSQAEDALASALGRINVEDLVRHAIALDAEKV